LLTTLSGFENYKPPFCPVLKTTRQNYRDQFDEILAKSSFDKLIADLRAKMPAESQ